MQITKCIIPAAGMGSRMAHLTNYLPKELFPIYNSSALEMIFDEMINAGINYFIIIISKRKPLIMQHANYLKTKYRNNGIKIQLKYVFQNYQNGLGDAVYKAKKFIKKEEYFLITLPDNLIDPKYKLTQSLIKFYNRHHCAVVGIEKVLKQDISLRGVILYNNIINTDYVEISEIIEKPTKLKTSAYYALSGRFILSSKIFDIIELMNKGRNDEIQLTDAMDKYILHEKIIGYIYGGTKYDIGNYDGYYKTVAILGLNKCLNKIKMKKWLLKNI